MDAYLTIICTYLHTSCLSKLQIKIIFYKLFPLQLDPQRFSGSFRYPLPSEVAEADRISKNTCSCVFTMYHSRKEYAVKKVSSHFMSCCVCIVFFTDGIPFKGNQHPFSIVSSKYNKS